MDQYIGMLLDNRYEILELIGVGGMAKVYKARCHRLNRLVAVKILRDDLAHDEDLRRRFNAESQAVAMLSHPNIVAVYDVSRSDENNYIVMELIDGISLKQYMQKKGNKLNWREALHFITQIVKALGHAHSRGIIHRDIKPHNVMVLRDGSVKVADFGIARLTNAGSSTLTKDTLGSVHYISPEQARGSHIDARSDLYSAGVVLYEMITGRLPFEGDTPVSVAIQHINSVPLSPRDLDPELPEALETITMKAMASNVDKRYISADAMLADLEEFRKNPSINFDYMAADFLKTAELEDEGGAQDKTRPVPVGLVSERVRSTGAQQDERRPRRSQREEERRLKEEDLDDRQEQSWPMYVAIVAVLLFTVGMLWFLFTNFLEPLFAPSPDYTIPNLVGSVYEEVLDNNELMEEFELVKVATVTDDRPEGTIIKQDPSADRLVKDPNTQIKVTVSGGPKTIIMPDVSEMEYTEAFLFLQKLGLNVSTPEYENHEEILKGHVISFTPLEHAVLKPGDNVQLVVSTGPRDKTEQVPLFIGQTVEWARDKLALQNLVVGEEFEVWSSEYPAGVVVDQSVEAYTEVPQGTKVNLQVSKGPDPTDQPPITDPGLTTNPTGGEGEQTFNITLPQNAGQVKVTVKDGSTVILDTLVNTALDAVLPCAVKGSGVKQYDIYFDNVFSRTQTVHFAR